MFQQTQRLRKTSGCYFFFTMTIPTKFCASTVRITSIQSKKEYQIYARSSSSFEQKGNLIICNEKKRMIICVYCNKLPPCPKSIQCTKYCTSNSAVSAMLNSQYHILTEVNKTYSNQPCLVIGQTNNVFMKTNSN